MSCCVLLWRKRGRSRSMKELKSRAARANPLFPEIPLRRHCFTSVKYLSSFLKLHITHPHAHAHARTFRRRHSSDTPHASAVRETETPALIFTVFLVKGFNVYDVTKYLDDHPGGDDVLISATGGDSTEEFEDAGHSKTARELMKDYCIGEIDKSHVNVIPELEIFTKEERLSCKMFNSSTLLNWALPAAIVGLSVAAAAVFYTRRK